MGKASQKVRKAQKRFQWRRENRRKVVAAVKRGGTRIPRPFASIKILRKQLTGLTDTGASVSLLGKGGRELVDSLGVPVEKYCSVVLTAASEDRSIIGHVRVPVEYYGQVKSILFYLCPYLEQTAYQGVDFWQVLGLAPTVHSGAIFALQKSYLLTQVR